MKRRTLSPEQKQAALAEAKEHGVAVTAKKYGISSQTIYNWTARNGSVNGKTKRTAPKATPKKPVPASPTALILELVRDGKLTVPVAVQIVEGLRQ